MKFFPKLIGSVLMKIQLILWVKTHRLDKDSLVLRRVGRYRD